MSGCRWVASDRPRVMTGRHDADCQDDECRGCQPCTERHCVVCGMTHADGACAGCTGEARENLDEIRRMVADLPAEAVVRGVDGEAAMLLGPATDPEAWGHREASALAGRIPADYLEVARDEQHPLWVLGTWSMVYRDAFEHDEPLGRVTVWTEAGYLERNLTYMATFEHVPFEDFARELRACRIHMERVLHDGEQIDEGVPCLTCGRALTRAWGDGKREDGWECKRCRQWSTEDQYRFAVKADYIANAEWLTDADMTTRTGVKPGTVRVWAQREQVARRLDSGRVVYSVTDVEARRDAASLAS